MIDDLSTIHVNGGEEVILSLGIHIQVAER